MSNSNRRDFLKESIYFGAGLVAAGSAGKAIGMNNPFKVKIGQKGSNAGVEIINLGEKLRVEINGELFTEYNFKDEESDFPYFYPVIGPTGVNITRNWPMKEGENEEQDHPNHRSLWFAHGDVNKGDFWHKGGTEKIVHDEFLEISSGPQLGVIQSRNKWMSGSDKVVCTDTRKYKFYNRPEGPIMDFEVTIHASNGEVTFGDTEEGSMAVRVASTMQVTGKVGKGHIINSEGNENKSAWGKRAVWCDYHGPLNDEVVGIAIFDHPQNPRHPTWWHVRTYGLFAANPFGVSSFEKKPKGTGDLTIKADENVTFRYRLYFHKGDEKKGKVAEYYREYAEAK